MKNFTLTGLGVALITPFRQDMTIDFDALRKHVERVIAGGADYLVVLGTTAETPTLSPEEDEAVKQCVKETNNGRLPLVIGIGGNCTSLIVDRLKNENLDGFDAVLSVVPFYNKPSQEGIYLHYKAIAEASPLPVILYNVPGRTGVNMLPGTVLRIARACPNVMGVKEASGKIEQVEAIVTEKPEGFQVVSGDDGLTLQFIAKGADGVISVLGNAYPRKFSRMVRLALSGDIACKAIDREFESLYRLLFIDGNPAGIKSALNAMYGMSDLLRLPLVPVSVTTRGMIKNAVRAVNDD